MAELPLIFDTLGQLLIACLVMVVTHTIYVLFGFGSGLIAVGCLAMLLPDIQDVVVLVLLVSTPAELIVVLSSRKQILWRGVLLVTLGVAVGIPAGTVILRFAEPTFILALTPHDPLPMTVGSPASSLASVHRTHNQRL